METTYYTLSAHEIVMQGNAVAQVSGGEGRRLVLTRRMPARAPRKRNNIISLADYRAQLERQEEPESLPVFTPRPRTDHHHHTHSGTTWLEAVTCASLIAMALSACAAFLF